MKTLLQIALVLSLASTSNLIGFSQEAPTGESPQEFCELDGATLADIVVEGTNITWFNTAVDGDILSPETILEDNTSYWAAQGTNSGAARLEVLIIFFAEVPAPEGNSNQYFCATENYTLGDLLAFNTDPFTNIYWHSTDSTNFDSLPLDTILTDGTTYYAFQVEGNCAQSLAITVHLETPPPAPGGNADQYFCATEDNTLEDFIVYNTEGYTSIIWFDGPWQGGAELNPTTPLINDTIYYAFQGIGACAESLAVTAHMQVPYSAPIGETTQYFPYSTSITLADLEVYNTDDYDSIYFSLEDSCGAVIPLDSPIVFGTTYYASQVYCACDVCCVLSLPITVSCNLGIANKNQELFSVYPNPTKDILNITSADILGKVTLQLFAINGQLVKEKTIQAFNQGVSLDVSELTKGLYFIKLRSEGKNSIQRLFID